MGSIKVETDASLAIGDLVHMKLTPQDVADYAARDSRALMEVASEDLVEELRVRMLEWAKSPAKDLRRTLKDMLENVDEYRQRNVEANIPWWEA